jgi:cell wall-associated NlpC family hydrolase
VRIFKSFVLALLVFFMFVGCAATTAFSRFRPKGAEGKKNNHSLLDTLRNSTKRLMTVTASEDLDNGKDAALEDDDDEFDAVVAAKGFANKDEVLNNLSKLTGNSSLPSSLSSKILTEAVGYLNTPYKYGGTSENGIDCSAFTQKVFQRSLELQIPRSTREQFQIGEEVTKNDELSFGDLVFFKTKRRSSPSHVGIYIGENKFMHASRKKGVIVSSLDEKYWTPRFIGARRLEITE